MSKKVKVKKDKSTLALRREIEALKAQLKESGIPLPEEIAEKTTSTGIQLPAMEVGEKLPKSNKDISLHSSDVSYLKKDLLKTGLISLGIFVIIISLFFLKLY